MIKIIFEIPDAGGIKDKRRLVKSILEKLTGKFRMSAAEIDLQDSITYAQIGGALVSNSKVFGEKIIQKAFEMIEKDTPVRIQDMSIYSQEF